MIYGVLSDLLLDGRYRVGEVIGSGGFGTVYAAMHVGLYSKVAIKVPRVDDLAPKAIPEAIARFLEEGRTLKRLRHPNLVSALDVGLLPPDPDGLALPYLVLEWCEGPTLKEWRAERPGAMAPTEAWFFLRPAFEAIAHAHAEGVAHRDIKPANIIMETTKDGAFIPRVIDFGIAKIVGPAEGDDSSGATRTTSSHRAFTPKYAAPEQLTGLRTGPRTDVYALALLLLEIVAGRPVFASDDEARRAIAESSLPTPKKLGIDLGGWDEVVERALAARATDRFADAGAFLRALEGGADLPLDVPLETPPPPVGLPTPLPPAVPAAIPGLSNPAPAPGGDDSVVPSSHTLRTLSTLRSNTDAPPNPRTRAAYAAGVAVVLSVAGALAFGKLAWSPAPPITSGARLDVSAPPSASPGEQTAPPLRPLLSLTKAEVLERAVAGGLTECTGTDIPGLVQVACVDGLVMLMDGRDGQPDNAARFRKRMQYQAKSFGVGGRVSRFTTDDTTGVLVSCKPEVATRVVDHLLAGIRHEAVGDEVVPEQAVAIPGKLADWKGPELAARAKAIGGNVYSDDLTGGITMVGFLMNDAEACSLSLLQDPYADAWLTNMKKGTNSYAYARDGKVLLTVTGKGKMGDVEMVKKILGPTTAAKIERGK